MVLSGLAVIKQPGMKKNRSQAISQRRAFGFRLRCIASAPGRNAAQKNR